MFCAAFETGTCGDTFYTNLGGATSNRCKCVSPGDECELGNSGSGNNVYSLYRPADPTRVPTELPTSFPTEVPTNNPTEPTNNPTLYPSEEPTAEPTQPYEAILVEGGEGKFCGAATATTNIITYYY